MTQSALVTFNINRLGFWLNTHSWLIHLMVVLAVAFTLAVLAQSAVFGMPPIGGGGCGGCASW